MKAACLKRSDACSASSTHRLSSGAIAHLVSAEADVGMLQKLRLPANHRPTIVLFDHSCRYELREAVEEARRQTGSQ